VHHVQLDTLQLGKGSHSNPEQGLCLLEAAAYFAGERHSDRPQCVSPVLAAVGRRLNDLLPYDKRQRLVPLVPQLVNTRGDGLDDTRRIMAVDWAVRVATPAWLDAAGMADQAARLRALAPIVDWASRDAALPVICGIRDEAWGRRQQWRKELRAKIRERLADKQEPVAAVVAAVVAVAAADADADADGIDYWEARRRIYDDVYAAVRKRYQPVIDQVQDSTIALYGRIIRPEAPVPA